MRLKKGTSAWNYDFQNIFFYGYSENEDQEIKQYFVNGYSENEGQEIKQYFVNGILVGYELDYGDKIFYI